MALPIEFFTSDTLLLKYIILSLDSTRTLPDLATYTSNHQLLYEIYNLLSSGGGTAGAMKLGEVTADGTTTTAIPDLAGRVLDTSVWIFHTGTKRDAGEITSLDGSGTLTWVSGWEPAVGTKINYIYF